MDKKVKQKQAGRWNEYVQKTKQVKETATAASIRLSRRDTSGKPAFAVREGKCQITR